MANTRLDYDKLFQLVLECRKSGLSDRQWCINQGVKQSTFYGWLKKLRERACYEIPESDSKTINIPIASQHQDVVRVNLVSDEVPSSRNSLRYPVSDMIADDTPIVIRMDNIQIGIRNSADPMLLANTLKMLKGFLC